MVEFFYLGCRLCRFFHEVSPWISALLTVMGIALQGVNGVMRDKKQAFLLWKQAADAGHLQAT